MNKTERIKKAIKDLTTDEFSAEVIYQQVKDYACGRQYVRSIIHRLCQKGMVRRLHKVGSFEGSYTLYTKKPLVKTVQAKQQELPLNLPMDKLGEVIYAYVELLKKQVRSLGLKLEESRKDANTWRQNCRNLQKTIDKKEDEIKTLRESVRNNSGKTFSMSEVAKVMRNGKLVDIPSA